jgi:hypothetical protein
MKTFGLIFAVLFAACLAGCKMDPVVVYVDKNGTAWPDPGEANPIAQSADRVERYVEDDDDDDDEYDEMPQRRERHAARRQKSIPCPKMAPNVRRLCNVNTGMYSRPIGVADPHAYGRSRRNGRSVRIGY